MLITKTKQTNKKKKKERKKERRKLLKLHNERRRFINDAMHAWFNCWLVFLLAPINH
jgi:hypothetical protein